MSDESQYNPYASPDVNVRRPQTKVTFDPLPCPQCESEEVQPTPYSGWYGRRAPRAIQDVTCQECKCNYDGETGMQYPPRKNPIVWFLLALVVFLLYVVTYVVSIILIG